MCNRLSTCTVITTQPNILVAPIHSRMPVILLPEDEDRWLDPDMGEPEEIDRLLRPYPSDFPEAKRANAKPWVARLRCGLFHKPPFTHDAIEWREPA